MHALLQLPQLYLQNFTLGHMLGYTDLVPSKVIPLLAGVNVAR